MNEHNDNPASNNLSAGITELDLDCAIKKSGYPLQSIVASWLRFSFPPDYSLRWFVEEEWSYVDSDTHEIRTMDIHASVDLSNWPKPESDPQTLDDQPIGNYYVSPYLELLVECKQSELPYVFFLTTKPSVPDFPMISGLHSHSILLEAFSEEEETISVLDLLGLQKHPFLRDANFASTFARCERKGGGDRMKLSGDEPYNQIVLPLVKSATYLNERNKPANGTEYFRCSIVFCIGILNAPMVGVRVTEQSHELTMLPWVRVVRHHQEKSIPQPQKRIIAIDVLHKDFFHTYMNAHLLPFAEDFSRSCGQNEITLVTGALVDGRGRGPRW
jgi:hypothetical protein